MFPTTKLHWITVFVFAAVAWLALSPAKLNAGDIMVDNAFGFSIGVPKGFIEQPLQKNAPPNIVHAWILDEQKPGQPPTILFIERMRGTIGREHLKREQMPWGFQGRLFTMHWQGFEVDAIEVSERLGDVKYLTYNVQIPLKKEAIQIKLGGPAEQKTEMLKWMEESLDGLRGESNWLPSALPASGLSNSEIYPTILFAIAGVVWLGGFIALYFISRWTPKGTILAISVVIWCLSWAAEGVRIREVIVMMGVVRLLGTAGVILGIVDLIRKRKPAQQVIVSEGASPFQASDQTEPKEK
jgi:hypothetical protein